MALLLADKRVTLWVLDKAPADPDKPAPADFQDAVNVSCKVFMDGTTLGATGSDVLTEPLLCGDNKSNFGPANYEGSLNVARFFDPETGLPDEEDDFWPLVKQKGAELWFAKRVGPVWTTPAEAGHEVSIFKVTTDTPQDPQSLEGYIKSTVPLAVSDAWVNRTVAAG